MNMKLYCGNCLEVLAGIESNSVDTFITDPPYGIKFMGKDWDHGIPGVPFWREALRVAKPGAMMLAFGGTRTHHWLMCAIEDAGWEIRDCLMWLYAQGFPKSHDISKAIDKAAGAEREVVGQKPIAYSDSDCWGVPNKSGIENTGMFNQGSVNEGGTRDITSPATPAAQLWDGWGTALKPAWEIIILAMKPRDGTFAHNALTWGVAGLWVDGGRIATSGDRRDPRKTDGSKGGDTFHGQEYDDRQQNYSPSLGRWPANLILDEEAAAMLDEMSGELRSGGKNGVIYTTDKQGICFPGLNKLTSPAISDTGGASRFFYCAKASRAERNAGVDDLYWRKDKDVPFGFVRITQDEWETFSVRRRAQGNVHSTVKPLSLMRYLVRLTRTPTDGIVCDPFMGSGSTIIAAIQEGRESIGIEKDAESFEIAERRIAWAQDHLGNEETRRVKTEKAVETTSDELFTIQPLLPGLD